MSKWPISLSAIQPKTDYGLLKNANEKILVQRGMNERQNMEMYQHHCKSHECMLFQQILPGQMHYPFRKLKVIFQKLKSKIIDHIAKVSSLMALYFHGILFRRHLLRVPPVQFRPVTTNSFPLFSSR